MAWTSLPWRHCPFYRATPWESVGTTSAARLSPPVMPDPARTWSIPRCAHATARALLAWQPGPVRRAPRRALLTGAGLSSPVRLALAGLSPPSGSLQASGVSSDGSGDSLWRSPSATRRAVLVRGFLLLCPALRRRPLVPCLGRRRLWSAGSPSALSVLAGCPLPAGGHCPAVSGAGPCSALAGLRRRRRDEPCSALGLLCCLFEGSSPGFFWTGRWSRVSHVEPGSGSACGHALFVSHVAAPPTAACLLCEPRCVLCPPPA